MQKKIKNLFIIEGIVLLIILSIGIGYAFLSTSDKQELANTFTSGCLNITIENESSSINLNNQIPITDIEGLEKDNYSFKIHNTCKNSTNYQINLESLNKTENTLDIKYVKVSISSNTMDNIITKLSDNDKAENLIVKSYDSRTLYSGILEGEATKEFTLKEWIDYDTTVEQGASKTYQSQINVIAGTNFNVSNTPEIQYTFKDGLYIGKITGDATTGKYCITTANKCEPSTNLDIEEKTAKIEIGNIKEKNMVCTSLGDKRTYCSNPNTKGIVILATLNGEPSKVFYEKESGYTPINIECTNGVKASFDYNKWSIKIDAIQDSTTCTVDFKENINQNFNTYLKSKQCTAEEIKTDEGAKDCLVNENGYRYEGSDPNNYVMFNNELWRVIGVFNTTLSNGSTKQDLVKLIRNTPIGALAWDGNSKNVWNNSTLKKQLNSGYLNSQDTTCNGYSTNIMRNCKFSAIGIKEEAKEKIEDVTWNLRGPSNNNITINDIYNSELTGGIAKDGDATGTGKIGLIYASDYAYAALANNCSRTTYIKSYTTQTCSGNNWIYNGDDLFTITAEANQSVSVIVILPPGSISPNYTMRTFGVIPSVYLKSNIQVKGGIGTIENPYTLN